MAKKLPVSNHARYRDGPVLRRILEMIDRQLLAVESTPWNGGLLQYFDEARHRMLISFNALIQRACMRSRTLAGSASQQAWAGAMRDFRDLSARTRMLLLNLARQVRRDEALSIADFVVHAEVERILNSQDRRDQSPGAQSTTMSAVGTNASSS
jgi:hypothetical protein